MTAASLVVKRENRRVACQIGIKPAARTTCVKPAGTTSLTLGTSSGIHAWHSNYYIRRMRVGKNESIYTHLAAHHPELIEDEYFRPHDTAVISVPQYAPPGAITREESALQLLKRVKRVSEEWVRPGHQRGQNTHNVSATVSIRENEWTDAGEWMWEPADGGTYIQPPFEDCSPEKYQVLLDSLQSVNLASIVELDDDTDLSGELACAGGSCELI